MRRHCAAEETEHCIAVANFAEEMQRSRRAVDPMIALRTPEAAGRRPVFRHPEGEIRDRYRAGRIFLIGPPSLGEEGNQGGCIGLRQNPRGVLVPPQYQRGAAVEPFKRRPLVPARLGQALTVGSSRVEPAAGFDRLDVLVFVVADIFDFMVPTVVLHRCRLLHLKDRRVQHATGTTGGVREHPPNGGIDVLQSGEGEPRRAVSCSRSQISLPLASGSHSRASNSAATGVTRDAWSGAPAGMTLPFMIRL